MSAIIKLSAKSQLLISELTTSNRSRSLAVSIVVARILSNVLILPSAPVENIENFYNTTARVSLDLQLYSINELFALDLPTIQDLVLRFYLYRYNSIYPCCTVIAVNPATAIVDFFRISKVLDAVTLACISEECVYITSLMGRFQLLLEELNHEH